MIENGYDEETFAGIESSPEDPPKVQDGRLMFVHSGIVYPSERDPTHLMQALSTLKTEGIVTSDRFRVCFRGSEHDAMLTETARAAGVGDLIQLLPPIPYSQALQEMMRADALLV